MCEKRQKLLSWADARKLCEMEVRFHAWDFYFTDNPWVPVIDRDFIPDDIESALQAGMLSQKDILTGANRDEGTVYTGM